MATSALSRRLLGFPIHLDPGFLLVLLVLGASGGSDPAQVAAYLVGAVAGVVVHELGHAVAARRFGGRDITIALSGFGGVTSYRRPEDSRRRTAIITAAGPAFGALLGIPVLLARALHGPAPFSGADTAYSTLLFVTIGWSILNLLPVLPLDGGHLLEVALPGGPRARQRIAAVVSIVVAGAAGFYFATRGAMFATLLFGVLALMNVSTATRRDDGRASGDASREALVLLAAGDIDAAEATLAAARRPDPALPALVQALRTGDDIALRRQFASRGEDPVVRSAMMLWLARQGEWEPMLALTGEGAVYGEAAVACLHLAYAAGAFRAGARLGELVLRRAADPVVAYNTACCWARDADLDKALPALMRAVDLGWTDWHTLETDPDLASVRAMPAYAAWRSAVAPQQ